MLLTRIWGDSAYRDPRTIDVHIRHLREKLETRRQGPRVPVHGARRRLPLPRRGAIAPERPSRRDRLAARSRGVGLRAVRSLRTRLALSLFVIVLGGGRGRLPRRAAPLDDELRDEALQQLLATARSLLARRSTTRSTAATRARPIDTLVRDAADHADRARDAAGHLHANPGGAAAPTRSRTRRARSRSATCSSTSRSRRRRPAHAADRDRGGRRGPRRRGGGPADLPGPAHRQARGRLGRRLLAAARRRRRRRRARPRPRAARPAVGRAAARGARRRGWSRAASSLRVRRLEARGRAASPQGDLDRALPGRRARRAGPARRRRWSRCAASSPSSTTRASASSRPRRTSCARRSSRSAGSWSCWRTRTSTRRPRGGSSPSCASRCGRLQKLATDLLDLSKLEAGLAGAARPSGPTSATVARRSPTSSRPALVAHDSHLELRLPPEPVEAHLRS